MKLNDYKIILISMGLIGSVLIASPAIFSFLDFSSEEPFSEMYLLDSNHATGNYPFNVVPNKNYTLYLNIGNYLGSSAYYVVYVKLLNASDNLPDWLLETPSSVQPLYQYGFLIQDHQTAEYPIIFSISDSSVLHDKSTISNLVLNGDKVNVNKSAVWNSTDSVYSYRLLFELWLFNSQSGLFQYNNRCLNLQLNYTLSI